MVRILKEKIARFFYGRYGIDKFGYFIVIIALVLSLVSSLIGGVSDVLSYTLWALSYVLLAYEIFRMLSRNISARYGENQKFLGFFGRIKKFFKLNFSKIRDVRTHRYFACPNCKNALRVPKGRGEITITCPVCKTKFDRRT